jgi:predicted flap endonuclease-1-like 5' DNA nuclease
MAPTGGRCWSRKSHVAYNPASLPRPILSLFPLAVNGLTLLVMLALAAVVVVAWRAGFVRGRQDVNQGTRTPLRPAAVLTPAAPAAMPSQPAVPAGPPAPASTDGALAEHARLLRSLEAENTALRRSAQTAAAERQQLAEFADDRRRLLNDLAAARSETARYRALVVDIENNAPPPLLDGPNAPDDLKLIVGIGPVLERMLHQLGVTTYRQIARWSERDIGEFDAKLAEFPGRIRRDGWVTQARALHQSKFGETLPMRER